MKRRSRTGSVKSRRRKAATPKRGNALNATRSRGASVAGEETVVARLARERDEALLREAANSEILSLISRSPGDLELVFRTILEDATRICNANFGTLFRFDGENFNPAAQFNTPAVFLEALTRRGPFKPASGNPLDHVMRTKQVAHSADMATEPVPGLATKLAGARTQVIVPMVKDDALIGAILIYRQEVRPFTDKQIELVKNFAAQAVIAIENARLLNELRESLQQQTATAEVLKVISSSPSDLTPVFEAILANAVNICGAKFGNLFLCDGDKFTIVAMYGAPAAVNEWWRANPTIRPGPRTGLARLVRTKQVNQTEDLRAGAAYAERDPLRVATVELAGARTLVDIPLLKDDVLVGAIVIYRQEVRLFAGKEIELLTNFAAQAVIAIENARLLNELRQSLEQQTAAADVLRIIASSRGELDPVFKTMLENARHVCDAKFGILMLCESDGFRSVAIDGAPPAYTEAMQQNPHIPPRPGSGLVVLVESKKPVQIADVQVDPGYVGNRLTTLARARTLLIVPLLKDGAVIGAINIYRQEVRAFTEQQIALVQNFAAQAVIAIENARLLNELRQRTEEVVKLNQQLEARVADQVGEIERMGRLRRFLPPQVADLIVASGTERQLESHRREITALFCDLRGFTGFSESSDPEDVMTLLRQYHAAIGEIIIKYSGTLERYAGDGVMVVFNDPVPVDNPALQAVRMALDMRSALGALIEKWRRLGHELGFGIGIAHGYATLGTIGFEGRFDYAAIGTVSNIASRLCDEAKPGQILISPRVLLAVEEAIAVEPAGDFALKGISRPLTAYNVVGAR
jgi:class 3 adenylate cyclase/putative methionine-R-sulfoxide reductase with GAF domain